MFFLLLFCFFPLACGLNRNASTDAPSPPPVETVVSSPAPIDWESVLKARYVDLALPDATERVSLWALGVRADENGTLSASDRALSDFADALCAAYRTDAVDASVTPSGSFSEPYTFCADTQGSIPSKAALLKALAALDWTVQRQTLAVPLDPVSAAVTQADLEREHALLSTYTTSFDSSKLRKANRVHNIVTAAARIDGVTVKPNEVFSINKAIGDRTKSNGYKLAGAIANGMNTTEYGGGVCQVSTTLFNAVLMADLEVVERYHHSWPMQYAPVGRDATIATGMKDFRFRNTSDAPVTIFASVDEAARTVSVSLYGKHSDAFERIEVVSEQTGRLPSLPGETRLDESLPPGTKEIERQGRRGRTSVTYLDYYAADGSRIKRVTAFEDTYPSIAEIAYVSTDLYRKR